MKKNQEEVNGAEETVTSKKTKTTKKEKKMKKSAKKAKKVITRDRDLSKLYLGLYRPGPGKGDIADELVTKGFIMEDKAEKLAGGKDHIAILRRMRGAGDRLGYYKLFRSTKTEGKWVMPSKSIHLPKGAVVSPVAEKPAKKMKKAA